MKMDVFKHLPRLKGCRLCLGIAIVAVILSELIVCSMSLLLKGHIDADLMITGLVTSGLVAPPILAFFNHLVSTLNRNNEITEFTKRRAESHLNIAIENSRMVIWEFDFLKDELRYDNESLLLLGIETSSPPHNIESWLAQIHPDDRAAFMTQFQTASRIDAPLFDLEYRYATHSGNWGWAHSRAQVIQRDAHGNPALVVGSTMNVTKRKQIELDLLEAKERFEIIFNNNPELMVISSLPDGMIADVNDAFCLRTGYTRQEALGRSPMDMGLWSNAADRQQMLDAIKKDGYCRNLEFEFMLKGGVKRSGSFSAVMTSLHDRPYLVSVVHDITDRKLTEASLQQQLLFSNALNQISRALVEQNDPNLILGTTAQILGEVLGTDRALIYDISFKNNQVTGLSEWLNPNFPDITSSRGTYPLEVFIGGANHLRQSRTWFTSHREAINPHLLNDGSGELLHRKLQIQSLLWYPFSFRDDEFYALVLNQIRAHKEWSKEEIGFLDSVSHIVSVELEKIRMIEERKKIEMALLKNEQRLHLALEAAHMGVWEFDFRTQELYWSPEIHRNFGMEEAEASRDYLLRITHPDDVNNSQAAMDKALREHSPYFAEYRVIVKGRWYWVEDRGEIQYDKAGNPLKVVGTAQDVTTSKQAEQELQRESEKNRALLRSASDGIHILDANANIIEVSDSFCELMGYRREELIGMNLSQWDVNFDAQEMMQTFKKQFENPVRSQFERRHKRKDGTILDVEISGFPLRLDGKSVVFNSSRDITQRKLAELELAESEARFRQIFNAVSEAIFIHEAGTGKIVDVNQPMCEMYGYTHDEVLACGVDDLSAGSPPYSAADVADKLNKVFTDGPQTFDWLARARDGHLFWVEVTLRSALIGNQQRILAVVRNIAERKQAEAELRASEEHAKNLSTMLRLISDNVPDMIWAKDLNKHFLFANKAMCDNLLNAANTQEPIGKDDMFFALRERERHPQEAQWHTFGELCQDSDAITLQRNQPSQFDEYGNVKGRFLFLDVHKAPFLNEKGEVIGVVGSARDVTRQREAEQRLKLSSLVLENSSEALLIADADNRIVDVNPAFTRLTGYELADVIGKDPSILHSERQDQTFYRAMWDELNQTGRWQGEIWNQRKDGEIYAEWLTINTLYHDDGKVFRRVALFFDITEKKKSEELIWTQANFDQLTQLPNRRMFRDRLSQDLKKAHRASQKLALLFLDLDRFKEINDTLGHDLGDELLVECARRISSCVRESDTVARLGGDEFTIILTELTDPSNVERIAEDILQKLTQPFHLGIEVVYISASIGITLYPDDANDLEGLQKNADQAMYVAKNAGRNRFSYFTSAMQEVAHYRLNLLNELRIALPEKQLQLYYQPIIELKTGRLRKAEALLRWFHPKRGLISPAEFIPLAEDSGLIHDIGDWVFSESLQQAKYWRSAYIADMQISVNMSPVELQTRVTHSDWQHLLSESGMPGAGIVVEITEGLLLDTSPHVTSQLLAFRDAGVQVAIDDFGTGYSALSYLKKLDIDYVKIDQSFIRNLVTDASDMALTEAMIVMAHKLGLQVIAEGVETVQQRDLLAGIGCDFVQGYLYSRPVAAAEFERLLEKSKP